MLKEESLSIAKILQGPDMVWYWNNAYYCVKARKKCTKESKLNRKQVLKKVHKISQKNYK